MHYLVFSLLVIFVTSGAANGAVITFSTPPFVGSDALTTPGRQIVGNEAFVTFDPAVDILQIERSAFPDVSDPLVFANGTAAGLPNGANMIVLQEFPAALNAGAAATLIANQLTTPGAGFFIYFNTGLNLPRLVYSTDLSDPTADLQVVARFTNLVGDDGRDAFDAMTAENFELVPEPSTVLLTGGAGALLLALRRRQVRCQR